MKKRKAFLYYRVSTTSEEQETSFITQSNYNSDEFDIIGRFGDKGTARHIRKRPNFKEMLKRCNIDIDEVKGNIIFSVGNRKPEVNVILVSHTSRFMRNQLLMKQCLQQLQRNNVEVIFLDLNKSSFDKDFDFTLNILFLLDEQESKNTSFKVHKGLEKARIQRNYLPVGGGKMVGFAYIQEENKLIKNNDAEIIVNIFNDYKNGESIRSLSSKYGYNQNKILRILDNEKYAGQLAYNKYIYDKDTDKRTRLSIKDYEYFKSDRIEPIISLELFEECQKIKDSRKQGNRKKGVKTYSLTSKIKCSKCGGYFFHHDKKGGYSAWKCLNKHNHKTCDIPSINENTILKYLKSMNGLSALKNGFKYRIDEVIEELSNAENESINEDVIKPLQSQMERLKKLYIMGDIEEEEYLKQRNNIKEQLQQNEEFIKQMQEKEKTLEEIKHLKENYLVIFEHLEDALKDDDKNKIFNEIAYIEIGEVVDVLRLTRKKAFVRKIMFKQLLPVDKYMLWLPETNIFY